MEIDFNTLAVDESDEQLYNHKEVYTGEGDTKDIAKMVTEKLTLGIICRGALGNRKDEELSQDKIMDRYFLRRKIRKSEKRSF